MRMLLVTPLLAGAAVASAQNPPQWDLLEELRIGAVDGPMALTPPSAMLVSRDRQMVFVAHRQEQRIRVFGAHTGREIRSIGRRGSGPGEFQGLTSLGWKGDTLYATDASLQRTSFFTLDGTHVRTQNLATEPLRGTGLPGRGVAYCADGSIIASSGHSAGSTFLPYVRVNAEGRVLGTLAQTDLADAWFSFFPPGGGLTGVRPLRWESIVAIAPDGCSLAVVHQAPPTGGTPSQYEVLRLRVDGSSVYRTVATYTPRRVDAAVRDSIVNIYATGLESRYGALTPQSRAALRDSLRLPAFLPPVSAVVLGADGSVWVQRYDLPDRRTFWVVLDSDGRPRANVRAPAGLRIMAYDGTSVWGTMRGELDVPYVVRYGVRSTR